MNSKISFSIIATLIDDEIVVIFNSIEDFHQFCIDNCDQYIPDYLYIDHIRVQVCMIDILKYKKDNNSLFTTYNHIKVISD